MESIIETLGKINFSKTHSYNNTAVSGIQNQLNSSKYGPLYLEQRNNSLGEEMRMTSNAKESTSKFVPHSARERREIVHQDRIPEVVPKYEDLRQNCESDLDHSRNF